MLFYKYSGRRCVKIVLSLCYYFFLTSCNKNSFIVSPNVLVTISADSLKYDTVFVTTGSTYRTFKIINENNQQLRLSSLKLMGGSASVYKMNVDGVAGTQFTNLEIEANDSLYVFAQVNVNPSAANLPFILRDSIEIIYNGNKRFVQLEAWGQNAHFFRNKIITTNESWNNDLPYVILGSLLINAGQTLTINKGCRIHVHADAPIVVNGTLKVNGLKDTADRVYFQGDRLDEPYRDFPASWPGIFFQANSINNEFNYAVIKNAYQAIELQDPASNPPIPKLTLKECVIENSYEHGIVSINSSISARNCLISNCGKNVGLYKGGSYQFTHCTIVSYSTKYVLHKDPVLYLNDYSIVNGQPLQNTLNALFKNCIFWGDQNGLLPGEIVLDKKGANFSATFERVLWRVQTTPLNATVIGPSIIQNPLFDSINPNKSIFNFRLKNNSPAIDAGINANIFTDLDGKNRAVRSPDLGAFENQ